MFPPTGAGDTASERGQRKTASDGQTTVDNENHLGNGLQTFHSNSSWCMYAPRMASGRDSSYKDNS
jgi:hypothetical protein